MHNYTCKLLMAELEHRHVVCFYTNVIIITSTHSQQLESHMLYKMDESIPKRQVS